MSAQPNASVHPTSNDNFAAGYVVGSPWTNTATTPPTKWVCTGDGVWSPVTGHHLFPLYPGLSEALTGSWDFQEPFAGNRYDSIGALDFTGTSFPIVGNGPSARRPIAADFNGSSHVLRTTADHKTPLGWAAQSFSFFLWFKMKSNPGSTTYIWSAYQWATNDRSWLIYWNEINQRPYWKISSDGTEGSVAQVNPSSSASIGAWHSLYCALDSGTGLELSIDAAAKRYTATALTPYNGASAMAFGANPNASPGEYCPVVIAGAHAFNRLLTDAEIAILHASGNGLFSQIW